MKKFILIAATAFVSLASFASVDPITGKVLEAFRTEFASAKNVQWKSLDEAGLYQATFSYRNTELSAFYDVEGSLVATARYIDKENLPIMVTKAIQEKYPEHVMKNVIEHIANGSTTYHVTLHGVKSSMIVSASPAGNLNVFKKIKNKL